MLNLRSIDAKDDTQTENHPSNFSMPRFRAADSLYGNLGEPLEHGASICGEGEDEGRTNAFDEEMATINLSRADSGALRKTELLANSVGNAIEVNRMSG